MIIESHLRKIHDTCIGNVITIIGNSTNRTPKRLIYRTRYGSSDKV
uniref:Uncharacterized protein n=1 Tax=Candidatus Kentrum sp. TUN TaxID=2126343 RepID=A0A450ZZW6_9GAMM|nr:MAG: hypothetical protein BECKTUN1418D_GA0071000_10997 [Candidatus Kentron sp. TUN]